MVTLVASQEIEQDSAPSAHPYHIARLGGVDEAREYQDGVSGVT